MLRDVVALVEGRIHPFELGVVSEVFGIDRADDGVPPFDFAVAGASAAELPGPGGTSLRVTHGLERLQTADLVVVPAWETDAAELPAGVAEALHAVLDRGALLLSVCSGVFLLAVAGLLADREVTCHWHHAAQLARRFPQLRVRPDELYVDTGQVITSAGTAAGIDACLHVVRRELGADITNRIARRMVVPPHREGGQAQYVRLPVPDGARVGDDLAPLLEWMEAHLGTSMTVADLARRARLSPRTFARRFTEATGTTPVRWLVRQRVLRAQQLLEQDRLSIDEVARHSGFSSVELLRHHFTRETGTTPTGYRRAFSLRAVP
ncbi:helix-turn-helix domain-containing protein [Actinomycetospora cinnamomea]|uniref:AraC family transcriptional regulator with amidase-like domain n=1 Tax=Actinomycetospora cinnamomea TaxID=663609 RepID=A0A2U1FQ73_9PSEU|nr:helix-turn-helix domain-containing protein [Actinomycetospora cinnamomea]PVZ14345.1 AraC family transcriptional regulator with amidase-like domain [Actinomycetospora cinnamomea]